jgi:predicted RNase H-like HicB family nuclease
MALAYPFKERAVEQILIAPATIATFAPEPFSIRKPIPVSFQESHGEYIASFLDAGVSAQGATVQEAFDNLKDLLLARFDRLVALPAEKLSPVIAKQAAVLREFIEKAS